MVLTGCHLLSHWREPPFLCDEKSTILVVTFIHKRNFAFTLYAILSTVMVVLDTTIHFCSCLLDKKDVFKMKILKMGHQIKSDDDDLGGRVAFWSKSNFSGD